MQNKKIVQSLATTHPELALQAVGWDPTTLTAGSGKKVMWRCQKNANHQWATTVQHRSIGRGCPFCAGRRVLVGDNDFATTHPGLALQAVGWDPTTLTAGSDKKVKWVCQKNPEHKYSAMVNARSRGKGCPFCSGRRILVGDNDFATIYPELAVQASGWDPKTMTAFSHAKVEWVCQKNPKHTYSATVANRSNGTGCPYCFGHKVLVGDNDLATTHPELALQASGWDPTTLTAGSHKKVKWVCQKNSKHIYTAVVYSRSKTNGNGCSICSGHQVLVGDNDLATTHPELAPQASGWDPTTLTAGSNKKVMWVCKNNSKHIYQAKVFDRSKPNGVGCSICSGHQVLVGYNDLATTHPELALQASGWDPTTLTAGSDRRVEWVCQLYPAHKWSASINHRSRGRGCPICANLKVLVGYNDLATTHPELALQAVGWDPTTLTAGSGKKVKWACKLNPKHIWAIMVISRARGRGCPFCYGRQILVGDNDLASTHPELALQAEGWDPTTLTAGSGKKVKWACKLNSKHIYPAKVSSRTRPNGTGCPSCASYGFNPNKDGFLYFIRHLELNMLQIGITNRPDGRLKKHKSNGWDVLEVRGPMDGNLAREWEKSMLKMLTNRGADLSNCNILGKFDGYTEAWSRSTFEAGSIFELMQLTEDFEISVN